MDAELTETPRHPNFFFKCLFILRERDRERERKRERASRGEAERERDRERQGDIESESGSRLLAVSKEPEAGLELTNCEIMT